MSVPHGCDGSATTKVAIQIPEDILAVTPTRNPYYDVAKKIEKLAEPVTDAHGNEVTERVASVEYTAKTPLPDGERDAFEPRCSCRRRQGRRWRSRPSRRARRARRPGPRSRQATRTRRSWSTRLPPSRSPRLTRRARKTPRESSASATDAEPDDDSNTGTSLGTIGVVLGALGLAAGGTRWCWYAAARDQDSAPGSPARRLRLLAGGLVGVALALAPAAPAVAHASLVETDPADGQVLAESPGVARLTFNESVSATAGGVQMYDARGNAVKSKSSARDTVLTVDVPNTLDEGTYVVSWRVVSADGRPVAGALTFSVGRPSAVVRSPPTPDGSSASSVRGALSAVQAIGYLGLFLAAGLVVFAGWLLPALPRLDVLRRRLGAPPGARPRSRRWPGWCSSH